jgi:N-acetylglucosamine kinase-like BadF-type ATPase
VTQAGAQENRDAGRGPSLIALPAGLSPSATPPRAVHPSGGRAPWMLGVDGGGTKTLAAVLDPEGHAIAIGEGGPSNPHSSSFGEAAAAIQHAVAEAMAGAGLEDGDIASAVLAIASIDDATPTGQRLRAEVPVLAGIRHVVMTNDVVAAWAASTLGQPGVAIISGTGSNAYGVTADGASWRTGGWGHILGDEGSAHAIGLAGMQAALEFRDGRGPWTAIVPLLLETYGLGAVEELHALVYERFGKSEIAAFARTVVRAAADGDPVAGGILETAARDLARQVCTVIRMLDLQGDFPVGLVGGTFRAGPAVIGPLERAIHAVSPGARVAPAPLPPVGGALWLAARLAGWEDALRGEPVAEALEAAIRAATQRDRRGPPPAVSR